MILFNNKTSEITYWFHIKKAFKFIFLSLLLIFTTKKGEHEEMRGPSGLFIDDSGNLYVLDLGEIPVVVLSSTGEVISQIGAFGNHEGNFLYPTGVVAKSQNQVFVLDNSRNTILSFEKKQ